MQPVSTSPSVSKTILYNGCTVAYTDEGIGPETLLFIHGLGTYGGAWQKNIATLKKHYRCVAIDLPGNGYSATGDYPYTMDFFARCIIDFIGRMGLNRVTLIGHSMGGQIAITAALLASACCDKIVLCAPAGFETFSSNEYLLYKASLNYMSWMTSNEQALQHLMQISFYRPPKDALRLKEALQSFIHKQPAKHYKTMTDRCMAAMLAEPVFLKLHLIAQPVLTIFGDKDNLIPNTLLHPGTTKQIAEAGTKKLKRGTLQIIRDCGHFLQWECADVVNKLIVDWLPLAYK